MLQRYRLIDIARQIDRDKTTLIRWEELGLIPPAQRDSRGWRYYSETDVKKILKLVKQTDYFRKDESSTGTFKRPTHRMVYVGVAIGVLIMGWQLFFSGFRVLGATSDQVMFTTVTAGTLSLLEASTSNSFTGVNVSFSAQTSTAPDLGAIRLSDARGSGAGWSLTLQGTDWKAGTGSTALDYDGSGNNDDTGKMCLIVTSGVIRSVAGQNTTGITKGPLSCFSSGTTSLTVYSASSNNGRGEYWITDFDLEQRIPANPTATSYTTTLTITLT